MDITPTEIPGVVVLTPRRFEDARGFFAESWNRRRMEEAGLDVDFVQDNHSLSREAGTVRGLHFQAPPHGQAKLVRCGRGALLDVVVDARRGSPSYGRWIGVELSAENGRQIFVPEGCLHGFATRLSDTEICYKCSGYYAPDSEGAVRFDDPDLAIDWGIPAGEAILSEKDAAAQSWALFKSPFRFGVDP